MNAKTCFACRTEVDPGAVVCPNCAAQVDLHPWVDASASSIRRGNVRRGILYGTVGVPVLLVVAVVNLFSTNLWFLLGGIVFVAVVVGWILKTFPNTFADRLVVLCPACRKSSRVRVDEPNAQPGGLLRLRCECGHDVVVRIA